MAVAQPNGNAFPMNGYKRLESVVI
jgi:hypothetical protein